MLEKTDPVNPAYPLAQALHNILSCSWGAGRATDISSGNNTAYPERRD